MKRKNAVIGAEWACDGLTLWDSGNVLRLPWPADKRKIRAFVQEHHLMGRSIVLALPRCEMFVGAFPLPLEEMVWADFPSGRVGISKIRFQIFKTVLEEAGFKIYGVGVSTEATVVALSHHRLVDLSEMVALVEKGAVQTQLLVCSQEKILFSRVFPTGSFEVEIKKSLQYFSSKTGFPIPPQKSWDSRPGLVAEGQAILASRKSSGWLVPPKKEFSLVLLNAPRLDLVLSAFSVLMVAGALGLHRLSADVESNGWKVHQELKQLQTGSSKPGNLSTDIAGPLFLKILRQVPAQVYLLDYAYDADRRSVVVRSRALDYAKVSEFHSKLEHAGVFSSVRPDKSTLVPIGKRSVVEFSLEGFL